jgi:hypothetical protein
MAINTIDPFGDFLNAFNHQKKLLEASLSEWDAILESGLMMAKGLEEICDCIEAKPTILFLKDVFSCGQGLSFLISMRLSILKDIAQLTQTALHKRYDA